MRRARQKLWIPILLVPYALYLAFAIHYDRGAIDYETFMAIGQRFLHGQPIWLQSSYYPIPYVLIYAFLSVLPRWLSIFIWHAAPVLLALAITNWSPWVLLFGPLFAHFTGGQSAVFSMLGLWGYRKWMSPDDWRGGVWLGILLIKPQLALVPLAWAGLQWLNHLRHKRRIPRQALAWVVTAVVMYAPGFLILPDWTVQWQSRLGQYNPIILRTEAGVVPRTLLYFTDSKQLAYWIALIVISLLLLGLIWLRRGRITFDLFLLWGMNVNPLVHDYDLIQLIPILDTARRQIVAAVLSIPLWLVILFAYSNDHAWYVVTFVPLGLLLFELFAHRPETDQPGVGERAAPVLSPALRSSSSEPSS